MPHLEVIDEFQAAMALPEMNDIGKLSYRSNPTMEAIASHLKAQDAGMRALGSIAMLNLTAVERYSVTTCLELAENKG